MGIDRVYIVWKRESDDSKTIYGVYGSKEAAKKAADSESEQFYEEDDDDMIEYYVEGWDVE